MKIAMFSDCFLPRINGVCISVKSFAIELAKKGHEVTIICPSYKDSENNDTEIVLEDGKIIPIYRLSSWVFIFSKEDRLTKITEWHKLKKYLDEFKPDILHTNTEFVVGKFAYFYGKHRNIPLIYTFHTYWENYFKNYAEFVPTELTRFVGRSVSKYFLSRANTIIAPTHRFAEVVNSYNIKSNMTILPTGISDSFESYDSNHEIEIKNRIKSLYPDYENKKILLYVGRVAKEKNLDFLLEAFKKIRENNENVILLIVGDGPELNALKKTALKSKYSKEIIFTGYFLREELGYLYKMCDIFVFPSLTETQGLVTIEAMTMGLPVVAIGEMGTLDVMQGDNGGFMTKNDVDEFTQKVSLLLQNKELHIQKSKEALEWSKQWSISSTTDKLLEIYKNAIIKE